MPRISTRRPDSSPNQKKTQCLWTGERVTQCGMNTWCEERHPNDTDESHRRDVGERSRSQQSNASCPVYEAQRQEKANNYSGGKTLKKRKELLPTESGRRAQGRPVTASVPMAGAFLGAHCKHFIHCSHKSTHSSTHKYFTVKKLLQKVV